MTVESHVADVSSADLARGVMATLEDPRGWSRAGVRFRLDDGAPYRIVLAEPGEVDQLCAPYITSGRYSCQIGPVVALNADRWRQRPSHWGGSLDAYRSMLVNHEVGHLIGQHHARPTCSGPGEPAAVMAQQTKALGGCAPNGWPLEWEVRCAAARTEPLAPPYDPGATATCGPAT
ncbi:MAG: putative rane protein [Ilumatobacteraceae bacterium]|nr:putative rane protein [Ilumatobacteraceae bacterium]